MLDEIHHKGKVGVLVVGQNDCWLHNPDSKNFLLENADGFEEFLNNQKVDVITYTTSDGTQMCDSSETSYDAGVFFKTMDVDLLFLFITAYIVPGRFLQGLLVCNAPVVVVGYQLDKDLSTINISDVQTYGGGCGIPEIVNAMTRCKKAPIGVVFGEYYGGKKFAPQFEKDISEWCRVSNCLRSYKGAIFGYLGHSMEGMLNINFDPTNFTRVFGIHIKMIEMCQLSASIDTTTLEEEKEKVMQICQKLDVSDKSCDSGEHFLNQTELAWAAKCSVGLDALIKEHNLSGMAYYYKGLHNRYESIALNLLVGRLLLQSQNYPIAYKADMKTCIAMFTTTSLGNTGVFADFNSICFSSNELLIRCEGLYNMRICDAKSIIENPELRSSCKGSKLYAHSNSITGPITLLGLISDEYGQFSFVAAEGVSKGENTSIDTNIYTRCNFGENISKFIEKWSINGNSCNFSFCLGHNASAIEKLSKAIGINFIRVG